MDDRKMHACMGVGCIPRVCCMHVSVHTLPHGHACSRPARRSGCVRAFFEPLPRTICLIATSCPVLSSLQSITAPKLPAAAGAAGVGGAMSTAGGARRAAAGAQRCACSRARAAVRPAGLPPLRRGCRRSAQRKLTSCPRRGRPALLHTPAGRAESLLQSLVPPTSPQVLHELVARPLAEHHIALFSLKVRCLHLAAHGRGGRRLPLLLGR